MARWGSDREAPWPGERSRRSPTLQAGSGRRIGAASGPLARAGKRGGASSPAPFRALPALPLQREGRAGDAAARDLPVPAAVAAIREPRVVPADMGGGGRMLSVAAAAQCADQKWAITPAIGRMLLKSPKVLASSRSRMPLLPVIPPSPMSLGPTSTPTP